MHLGLDLAGAGARAVLVDEAGRVTARADHADRDHAADAVRQAIEAAAGTPAAAGLAVPQPGDVPPASLQAALTAALPKGLVVSTVAAGPAAALAEAWCGAARGETHVAAFSLGAHVTAGVLVDGQVWRGARGLAGSVGWLALNPVERDDYRRFGGLEAEISAAGIVRRLVWRIKSGDRSAAGDQVDGELSRLTAAHVFQCARAGDGVCVSVVRDTARYAGMAVANLVTFVDPSLVVLGGLLAEAGDLMLEPVRQECLRRLRPAQAESLRLVLSTLGADAVAIGAARAAGGGAA